MHIITAPSKIEYNQNFIYVFLAGGITKCYNWQEDVIDSLLSNQIFDKNILDRIVILNPRRSTFNINDATVTFEQIKWEYDAINNCDIFSMYFCNSESVQPICLYELGRIIENDNFNINNTIISIENGYQREYDVIVRTALHSGSYILTTNATPSSHAFNIYNHCKFGLSFKDRGNRYV